MNGTSWDWAREEFGRADLGDVRRTARLIAVGAAACERPSGKVAGVFGSDREREGAYDFLESRHVPPEEIMASIAGATMARCAAEPFVFVPVDGTSITVSDERGERDFGNVGSNAQGARGLKIIDALAVDPEGTVVGWLALTFWARDPQRKVPARNTRARGARPVQEKETQYWIDTARAACAALDEHGKRGWFQIDREGDGRDLLMALRATKHWWTVRGNADRSIEVEGGNKDMLRAQMAKRSIVGTYDLPVTARPGRAARVGRMVVRVAQVVLRLRDKKTNRITRFPVNVVWAREEGTTPVKEDPIDWLLFTNRGVETFDDAQVVINGYVQRWRVEECHRTWKSGECDIEATQLQSFAAVQRWAIILGAIATRIERLKRLARTKPDSRASVELSALEIRALKMLKFGADVQVGTPTIAQAVGWLAELGGWTHKYSGRPPGATVLGRGLRHLRPAAHMLAIQGCER
jgi:Transposase DNA-binding/Transposase DDE domain